MLTSGFSVKPLKVKLLAGEQKATEGWFMHKVRGSSGSIFEQPTGKPKPVSIRQEQLTAYVSTHQDLGVLLTS